MRKTYLVFSFVFFPLLASAQIKSPVINVQEGYKSSFGGGVSYGINFNRDADFWGFAMDYSTLLGGKFAFISSLSFDQETETISQTNLKIVNTFTLVVGFSYLITDRLTVTTGLGKGFLDDGNDVKKLQFTNGDLGTGLVFGYVFPDLFKNNRYVLSFSTSFEYNMSQSEYTNSYDLGIGYSF